MQLRWILSLALGVVALAPIAIGSAACSSGDDQAEATGDDEIRSGGGEGAVCNAQRKCKTGLKCKTSSGPPPGAVGLPMPPSSSSSNGPPPGAVGLPLPPDQGSSGRCAKPGPGEEGGSCSASVPCLAGLVCDTSSTSSSGGPPPGAVGLPMPPSTGSSGPPSGAVGLPIPPSGVCKASSGPPPGAVGLPIPPGG